MVYSVDFFLSVCTAVVVRRTILCMYGYVAVREGQRTPSGSVGQSECELNSVSVNYNNKLDGFVLQVLYCIEYLVRFWVPCLQHQTSNCQNFHVCRSLFFYAKISLYIYTEYNIASRPMLAVTQTPHTCVLVFLRLLLDFNVRRQK